jgi:PleD family two-component response regulator
LLDPLTGVLRAEQVPASLQKYLARLREAELPFAMRARGCGRHLRRYNDQYGEPRGDRILKALSQFLQARLREDDLIGAAVRRG